MKFFKFLGSWFITKRGLISMETNHSSWSGLVTHVQIGDQDMSVSLDFRHAHSSLYKMDECVAFSDTACFDPSKSDSFMGRIHAHAQYGFDEWVFPNGFREVVWFWLVDNRAGLSGRDTAGSIGTGPMSPLFYNRIMHLSEESKGSSKIVFQELSNTNVVYTDQKDDSRWSFQAFFASPLSSSREVEALVYFDAGVSDIVGPPPLMAELIRALIPTPVDVQINRAGHLEVDCDEMFNVIVFITVQGIPIAIPILLLGPRTDSDMCRTIFRIDPNVAEITIGRLILGAVDSVVLNYRTKKIGFVVELDDSLVKPVLMKPTTIDPPIPILRGPLFQGNRVVFEKIHHSRVPFLGKERLFFLSSVDKHNMARRVHGSAPVECWTLLRLAHIPGPTVHGLRISGGIFNGAAIDNTANTLEFVFGQSGIHRNMVAATVDTATSVEVCTAYLDRYMTFDLPESQVVSQDTTEECAICLEQFKKGETLQSLNVCQHNFHWDCLNEWLGGIGDSCPLCRRPIPLVQVNSPLAD